MIVYKLKFVGDGEFIIISPPILHRLIEKVKMSSEKELSVDIDRLFPKNRPPVGGLLSVFADYLFIFINPLRHPPCTKLFIGLLLFTVHQPIQSVDAADAVVIGGRIFVQR